MPDAALEFRSCRRLLFAGALLAPCIALASLSPSAAPVITFAPLTPTTLTLPDNATAVVQYQVTNRSVRTHQLVMQPIPGVTMLTASGDCITPFMLDFNTSCVLDLQLTGSAMQGDSAGGPVVCDAGDLTSCYQPSIADRLDVTLVHSTVAAIEVDPSSLSLAIGGAATITVSNIDESLAAQNLRIDIPVDSAITVVSSTCPASLPPDRTARSTSAARWRKRRLCSLLPATT